jgi:pyruvate/2-oxoglutarate dehydrogenase complex dihydrolipoamide dehydrogenase (E3) component
MDERNARWRDHVHPKDWRNPTPQGRYNMVVLGAGPAGLVAAAAVAGMGGKVALVERGLLGGDCLNVGCVPSKALIRCARAAAQARNAGAFGLHIEGKISADFGKVMERLRSLRARLSHHDSVARFTELGVDVYLGEGRFAGKDTIEVAGARLHFARALIATGARASAPPIKGLDTIAYLTNETLFTLTTLPKRLAVIGGGPIGCEMAQAFARLGAEVTLIEAGAHILPRDDAEAAHLVEAALKRDGVKLFCGGNMREVGQEGEEKILRLTCEGVDAEIRADEVLVAAGRAPNVEALHLEQAGVDFDLKQGVRVNDFLQTSNGKVYAAGDVASAYKFTHAADAMARIVVRNALFFGRQKVSALKIPWVTYTDPEIAHMGMTAEEAESNKSKVDTIRVNFSEVDRAVLDGDEEGFVRIFTKKGSDTILGATIVARHAGDLISEVTTLMMTGKGLGTLANTIHPYPTHAEILKKAADAHNRTRLTPRVRRIFEMLLQWRR